MEFGLFTEFPSPPGVTEAAAFDESLAQMKAGSRRSRCGWTRADRFRTSASWSRCVCSLSA